MLFTVSQENTAMKIHKNTKRLPHHREAIWRAYHDEKEQVPSLARRFHVSRPTIYNVLKKARAYSYAVR